MDFMSESPIIVYKKSFVFSGRKMFLTLYRDISQFEGSGSEVLAM